MDLLYGRKSSLTRNYSLDAFPTCFFSTAVSQAAVIDAYSASVQGFFVKQTSMVELEKTITVIMEYWKRCSAPNNF